MIQYLPKLALVVAAMLLAPRLSAGAEASLGTYLVAVSSDGVLSIRLQRPDDPSRNGCSLQSLRFGDSKSLKLEASLRKRLDANGDGQVSRDEFRLAEMLLNNLDFDDDECLAPLEIAPDLLTRPDSDVSIPKAAGLTVLLINSPEDVAELNELLQERKLAATKPLEHPDATLSVQQGQAKSLQINLQMGATAIVTDENHTGPSRIRLRKGAVELELWSDFPAVPATAESKVLSELAIHARPGRRGWFEWIDTNGDGRLSRTELRRADQAVSAVNHARDSTETLQSVSVRLGPPRKMPRTYIPLVAQESVSSASETKAPGWFVAMDRNADGHVSINEFLGGDDLFARFDKDKDTLLSASEAAELPQELP